MVEVQSRLSLLLYQCRILFSWAYLVPAGIIILYVGSRLISRSNSPVLTWINLVLLLVMAFPPISALLLTPVIAEEREQRTLSIITATATPLTRIFITRFLLIQLYIVAVMATVILLGYQLRPILDMVKLGLIAISPTLFLGLMGAAIAHLTASSLVGYVVSIGYWMLNSTFSELAKQPILRYIYLFSASHIHDEKIWQSNKLVLLTLAGCMFLLNLLLLQKPEKMLTS